ncbi:MAG TPA: hypothetical protein PKV82_04600 [Anaerolineae bacterium]|nr:hypothetical protein [Anaerolineae bacterium]
MHHHPEFYTALLRRRLDGDPMLTGRELRELDLHLLGCPVCNFVYLAWLGERDPERADGLLRELEARLRPQHMLPYLPELVQALYAPRALHSFESWLWEVVQRDHVLLGQLRLAEAQWLLGLPRRDN